MFALTCSFCKDLLASQDFFLDEVLYKIPRHCENTNDDEKNSDSILKSGVGQHFLLIMTHVNVNIEETSVLKD